MFKVVRIYEFNVEILGTNPAFFIDRLYPRGIAKAKFTGIAWLKDLAPSNELRNAFHKNLIDFNEFAVRYKSELKEESAARELENLRNLERLKGEILLLTAVKDLEHSHVSVLLETLAQSVK